MPRTTPFAPETAPPRRGFLARLLAGTAALAVGPHLGTLAAEEPGQPGRRLQSSGEWDDSWVTRITAPHRQVFDSPEIEEGVALHQARTWIQGYKDVYGTDDGQHSAVIVIRHRAVAMVMQDSVWDQFDLGKDLKLKDPTTGKWARRNPFINVQRGDRYARVWSDGGLDTLMERGAIVVACNLALQRFVRMFAKEEKLEREAAQARMVSQLVPGVVLQPSGIFGVTRAQEAGCHYIRSG